MTAYRDRMLAADEAAKPNATEAAVRLAGERGVEVAKIPGTGTDGRVTKADVETALGIATVEQLNEGWALHG